ncbi:protein FAM177B [Rhynchophorus ferrugineus]
MVFIQPEDYADDQCDNVSQASYKMKTPKRVIQCSDGILEEYSTDEEEEDNKNTETVDPATLQWGPWFYYKVTKAACTALSAMEYMGENLAWFFGITSPKYYFELEEYKRRQESDKLQADKEQGWCDTNATVQTQGPSAGSSQVFAVSV